MPPVRTLAHCAAILVARIAATLIVRAWGLRALSDDDFSRVTIAQNFALHPRLDPTGTSWLPAPFWIQGGLLALFGRSLAVADLLSSAGACLAALLLYAAARWSGLSPRVSLVGALAAAVVPVAAVTGAANVPELPVACCTAAALILLRERTPARSLGAAALLLPATLSRYEPWPAALAAAVLVLVPTPRVNLRTRITAALIALAGPALWIAWNAHAHADPLHFHARVSAYRTAVGATAALGSYPLALALELVPVAIAAIVALVIWRAASDTGNRRRLPMPPDDTPQGAPGKRNLAHETEKDSLPVQHPRWSGPLAAAAFVLIALVAAEARGGAPTHHPERAVLAITIVAWVAAVDLLDRTAARLRPTAWLAGAAVLLVIVSGLRLRSLLPGYGVDRSAEIATGRWIAEHVPSADRVMIEPSDYGYFAIMAASGRPETMSVTRTLDPRKKDEPSLDSGARWIVRKEQGQWRVRER